MKALWGTLAMLLALAGPLSAYSSTPQYEESRPAPASQAPVSIAVDSIALENVSSDQVSFAIQSHVTARRTLRLQRVRFEQMRLGSLPVYLEPLTGKLDLTAGTPVALPPVPLTIYYRDLHSLEPLEQIVSDGRATVNGEARVDLDLNLLKRFGSNQWNAHADMPVNVSVPVEIPGGFLGRAAAMAALKAAEFALNIGQSGLNVLRHSPADGDGLQNRYAPSLVIAESRYSLLRNQQREDMVARQLGFRISADKFILTGEMLEPWKFDVEVATALRTGNASLIEGSSDLIVWPAGAGLRPESARSLSRDQIQLLHAPAKLESTAVPTVDGHVKVRISRRDSNRNYAVLRFTHPEDQGAPLPFEARHEAWQQLGAFRVNDQGQVEPVSTTAHREGKRILLDHPLDPSAFGSILVSDDGAVGMLQDEHSGMLLRNKW